MKIIISFNITSTKEYNNSSNSKYFIKLQFFNEPYLPYA
jgi:hypothetical protein